jgi:hypothetical protein
MIIDPFSLTKSNTEVKFDFDALTFEERVELAEKDIKAFDEMCNHKILSFINSVEDEDKKTELKRLHFNTQAQLRKHKDPTARMNVMVVLFWEGVFKFRNALEKIKK